MTRSKGFATAAASRQARSRLQHQVRRALRTRASQSTRAVCSLRSCMELIEGDGIGLLREEEGHETWQCIRDHYCAADIENPWFCFVYHETRKVFTPWGHNSQLKLVSPAPCACKCACA